MKIAYLVNQYPSVSHSFIRREIRALEQLGLGIDRISIRESKAGVCDQKDIEELKKTRVLLNESVFKIIACFVRTFLFHPSRFFVTLKEAFYLGTKDSRGMIRYLFYFIESCLLLDWSSKAEISHIHAHFGTNSTTVALLCKKLGGPSYSFTVHGPEEFDAPVGLSLSKKISEAQYVVAISSYCRSQLMRWCDRNHWSKIQVIHCTIDDSFWKNQSFPDYSNNRFVCVGRLNEQKGQLLLLDALKVLSDKGIDFEMVFAGDGEMRQILEERIDAFGLQEKITITGWLREDQVREEILQSRALLLPSFAEGLPVVIMEALSLHRPVITTYVAGIPELVDSKCGRLVPAGSLEAIVSAVEDILKLTNSDLLEMGRVGSTRVLEYHSDKIEASKLYNLFKSIN